MSFNFTTSGAIIMKMGANGSSVFTASGALLALAADQAESFVNVKTKHNWSDEASLNDDVKFILSEIASNIAATYGIEYDMSGFTNRREAETMLDILRDRANLALTELKEVVTRDFVTGA